MSVPMKMVFGVPTPWTDAELAARAAEDAAFAAAQVPDARSAAAALIDAKAGQVRARYITITGGQEATYLLKAQAASAYKAGGYIGSVPAMVQAEATATGRTAQQAADDILAQQDAWIVKGSQIEQARRAGKIAAAAALDVAGVLSAQAAAIAALDAL